MNQINYDNNRIRDSTYGIAILLSNMYFAADDPMRKEIQGDYMMKVDCISEAIQDSYDEGEIKGEIKMVVNLFNSGKLTAEDTASELLSLNCKPKMISNVTGLSENKISKIRNNIPWFIILTIINSKKIRNE